jgi:hypothetical protein
MLNILEKYEDDVWTANRERGMENPNLPRTVAIILHSWFGSDF